MYDTRLRPLIDPPLDWAAGRLRTVPVTANHVTVAGFIIGLFAASAIVAGWFLVALAAILLNRIADGLDGAIARRKGSTRLGGYLDIVFDFFFYGAIPLAFAFHDPAANALAATVLLASFYANGATFLGFSAVAAKLGLSTEAQGKKTIYYFAGLAEGAETIGVFCLMALIPGAFAWLAYAFAALCFLSAGARVIAVWDTLRADESLPGLAADGGQPRPVSGRTSPSAD